MIAEPRYPMNFIELVQKIVDCELEVDRAKSQINLQDACHVFRQIDHLQCGQIFMEDLYAYLKRKAFTLNTKDIKFLNKYFGFSTYEKLSEQLFKKKFLQFSNPEFKKTSKKQNSEEAFLSMIRLSLECYSQIEILRAKIVNTIEELQECFQQFYPQSSKTITKAALNEVLSCQNMYSRLNANYLCKYIIGQEANSVSLKHIFWKESSSIESTAYQKEPTYQNKDLSKKLNNFLCNRQDKKKSGGIDILSQIDNIEAAYKQKRQQAHHKTAGLIHRFSDAVKFSESRPPSKDKQIEGKPRVTSNKAPNQKQNQDKQQISKDIEDILRRSLEQYKSDDFDERQAQIESLYRKKKGSQLRPNTVSRTSSAAKLKIQEIEKRVFSRNKITNVNNLGLRTPSNSNMILNSQARSRFSSLKKK